jgi:hypothetical protein
MPFTYLPGFSYLALNGDMIEFVFGGKLAMSMTAEDARSNAADLIDAADRLEGKGAWARKEDHGKASFRRDANSPVKKRRPQREAPVRAQAHPE